MFPGYYLPVAPTVTPGSMDDFPHEGAGRIGNRTHHQEPETSLIAACHFLIANPQQGRGASFVQQAADTIANVHAINPDCQIYFYTDPQETSVGGTTGTKCASEDGPTGAEVFWGAGNNDWFCRDSDGDLITGFSPNVLTNITRNVQVDSFGERLPEWYANSVVIPVSLAPHNSSGVVVGIYNDVAGRGPVTQRTDLNGDGQQDDAEDNNNQQAAEYRQGHRDFWLELRNTYPDMPIIVNGRTWGNESTSLDPADWGPGGGVQWSHYEDIVDGAWMEGQTDAPGTFPLSGVYTTGAINLTFGSWRRMMNSYLFLMRFCRNSAGGWPHVLNQYSWLTNPTDANES